MLMVAFRKNLLVTEKTDKHTQKKYDNTGVNSYEFLIMTAML